MDWSPGRGFYSTLVDGESVWILGIKKKIFLFRDLFYCDLLLGSPVSVDKCDPYIKINRLRWIVICEWSVILVRISWDQSEGLYTTQKLANGYSLDNYRLIQAFNQSYPHKKVRSLQISEQWMPWSQPNFSRIFRNLMFKDVDPQRFTHLFCATRFQFGFQFVDRAAKRVIFTATDTDGTKANQGEIRFLLA